MHDGREECHVNPPTCKTPVSPALLSEYWLEELEPQQEEQVEEHLLGCDACSRDLQDLVGLIEAIRGITRKGLVRVVVSETFLDRLRSDGLKIRQYSVKPGHSVACTITDKDDLVLARLAADLKGARRVDLAQCDAEGIEVMRIRDIPLITDNNEVVLSAATNTLRALGEESMRFRLVAVDDAEERVLGEYTFNHTPTR
jgi:hypothetical protein